MNPVFKYMIVAALIGAPALTYYTNRR